MILKLQGKWEADRIASMLESARFVSEFGEAWAKDCAKRIRNQVEAERKRTGRAMP